MFFIDALIQFGKVPSNSKFDKKFSSGMSGDFFFKHFSIISFFSTLTLVNYIDF